MTRLPRISSRDCVRALERAGFRFLRQQGSHFIMRRDDPKATVVIPLHDLLGIGILRAVIRDAGLTREDFIELLRG